VNVVHLVYPSTGAKGLIISSLFSGEVRGTIESVAKVAGRRPAIPVGRMVRIGNLFKRLIFEEAVPLRLVAYNVVFHGKDALIG